MSTDDTMPSVLQSWRVAIALAFRAWPLGALLRCVLSLMGFAGEGLVQGLALRAILLRNGHGVLGWYLALLGTFLVQFLLSVGFGYVQSVSMFRTGQAAAESVMEAGLRPAGLDHFENPIFADRLAMMQHDVLSVATLFDYLIQVAGTLTALVAASGVLIAQEPLLAILILAAGALGLTEGASRRRALEYVDKTLTGQRLTSDIAQLSTSAAAAREVKVYGMAAEVLARYDTATETVRGLISRGEGRAAIPALAGGIAQGAVLIIGVLVLAIHMHTHAAADLALGIVILLRTLETAGSFGSFGADIGRCTNQARRYLWLRTYTPEVVAPPNPIRVPDRLNSGICLSDVTFRYRASAEPTLEGLTFDLPAGSTVALVGDNGAGKTTLVKLLLRFYDPTSGMIQIDETALQEFDPCEWRSASSGTFQDYLKPYLLIREVVGIGNLAAIDDIAAIEDAAARGEATAVVDNLASGWESQLGPTFGGPDLSEGQWQRLAVARGLMRLQPLLTILDEPTAALDPMAEASLFRTFVRSTEALRSAGGVVVIVSHRFSTVRLADLIVVLDRGRIIESGSHEDLVRQGGRYSSMYAMQASRYQ